MAKRPGSIGRLTTLSLKGPRKTKKRLAVKRAKVAAKTANQRYVKGT